MKVRFLGQPFDAQTGLAMRDMLADARFTCFLAITAWTKHSALSRLGPPILELRARGGFAEAVIGIDEGGATEEGLRLAMEVFDRVHVFHDPGPRTFHPKVYVAEGDSVATAIIGSSNLTKGGMYTNYEASLLIELVKDEAQDAEALNEIKQFYDRIMATGEACQELDDHSLEQLLKNPRYRIGSEAGTNRRRAATTAPVDDAQPSIFGDPVAGLPGAPPRAITVEAATDGEDVGDEDDDDSIPEPPSLTTEGEVEADPGAGGGVIGFWKALSQFDTSKTSGPGQIIIPIRFLDFFGTLSVQVDETPQGGVRQSHRQLVVVFRDSGYEKVVDDARVILYEPAETHPRPNAELRFAFRDREVFNRLTKDDILVFTQEDGQIIVSRQAAGARGPERFGAV
jgi:hypothetical protein